MPVSKLAAAVSCVQQTSATPLPHRPWSAAPHCAAPASHQKVVFGGQVTEEFESLNKRKQCSAPKWKEMTGSGIFAAGGEDEEDESGNASATPIRTAPKNYQGNALAAAGGGSGSLKLWDTE